MFVAYARTVPAGEMIDTVAESDAATCSFNHEVYIHLIKAK